MIKSLGLGSAAEAHTEEPKLSEMEKTVEIFEEDGPPDEAVFYNEKDEEVAAFRILPTGKAIRLR
jgi:hypothetical protein